MCSRKEREEDRKEEIQRRKLDLGLFLLVLQVWEVAPVEFRETEGALTTVSTKK